MAPNKIRAAGPQRANLGLGYVYAITGSDGMTYAGQIATQNMVGFFRWRGALPEVNAALECPLMFRCGVSRDSVGRALRAGVWKSLGLRDLHAELRKEPVLVQWPTFSSHAKLWQGEQIVGITPIDDPAIQQLEVIAAWHAQHHIPHRLTAEYHNDDSAWSWRGRVVDVRRQRSLPDIGIVPPRVE